MNKKKMLRHEITAIIWDLDDVLLNTRNKLRKAQLTALKSIKIPTVNLNHCIALWDRFLWYFDEDNYHGILKAILYENRNWLFIDDEAIERAVYLATQVWNEPLQVSPIIRNSLEILRDNNIKMAIVSNGEVYEQINKVTKSSLAEYFQIENIIISRPGSISAKPNPDNLLLACKLLETPVNRSLFIGDRPTDIVAANLAGIYSVLLENQHGADYKPPTDIGILQIENPTYRISIRSLTKLIRKLIKT